MSIPENHSETSMAAERRYRRLLLLLLPWWYRQRYAEEMVEVYLAARPDHSSAHLGVAEVAATARLAVSTRARQMGAPSRMTLVLLAVAGSAALASAAVFRATVTAVGILSREVSWSMGADGRLVGAKPSLGLVEFLDIRGLVWVVVLAALLAGLRRTGVVLAAFGAALDVGSAFSPFLAPNGSIVELALARTDARSALLPVVIVSALALAGITAGAKPTRTARLIAAVGTAGAVSMGFLLAWAATYSADSTAWPVTTFAVAAAAAAVVVLLLSRRIDPAWPATVLTLAALVVLAGPLPAGSRVVTGGYEQTVTDGPLDPVLIPGLLLGAAAVALAAVAWIASTDRHAQHPTRHPQQPGLATS